MAEEINCFDLLGDDDLFFDFDPSSFIQSSPDSANSWIGEIEQRLMNDDNNQEHESFLELDEQSVSEFLSDILVDYPTTVDSPVVGYGFNGSNGDLLVEKKSYTSNDSGNSASPVDLITVQPTVDSPVVGYGFNGSDDSGKEKGDLLVEKKSYVSNDSGSENQDEAKLDSEEVDGDDDDMAKKRRRRVRNRDAAVRSRERKKEYVTDLEKKSKYLERECMRLGRMLECFVAENHSLRLCLQKGSGNASTMTRQESAVLLLESLLLGSLLWYLGDIICQFPRQPLTKCCFPPVEAEPEKLVLSGLECRKLSNNYNGKNRRCKGSRPRMKHQVFVLVA